MNSLLSRFRRAEGPRTGGRDRRVACRYPARGPAVLGWHDGAEFRTSTAAVKNVGFGGAAVLVDAPPAGDAPVWFRLECPSAPEWVEATVRGRMAAREPGGASLLRLEFAGGCPYEVFAACAAGLDACARPEVVSPEFDARLWR